MLDDRWAVNPEPGTNGDRFDLVLRNATVLDADGLRAGVDVAVADGTIAAVGDLSETTAPESIDCAGMTIVPGFINAHHHFATGLLREVD